MTRKVKIMQKFTQVTNNIISDMTKAMESQNINWVYQKYEPAIWKNKA